MSVKSNTHGVNENIHERFKEREWKLSKQVSVRTHHYDKALYAFEFKQGHACIGTFIPKSTDEMYRMENVLNQDMCINGFECNDGFGTILHVT